MCKKIDHINHGADRINDLTWQTPDKRRAYYFIVTLKYKCVHGLAPLRICDEFELVWDGHDINTCNSNSLNSFKYFGVKVWNGIPNQIHCATSVDSFKYLYKKYNV